MDDCQAARVPLRLVSGPHECMTTARLPGALLAPFYSKLQPANHSVRTCRQLLLHVPLSVPFALEVAAPAVDKGSRGFKLSCMCAAACRSDDKGGCKLSCVHVAALLL